MTGIISFEKSYKVFENPFTKRQITPGKATHKKFIESNWMTEEGKVIITKRLFDEEIERKAALKVTQKPTRSRRSIGRISKAAFSDIIDPEELEVRKEEYMFEIEKAFKEISIDLKLKNLKHEE